MWIFYLLHFARADGVYHFDESDYCRRYPAILMTEDVTQVSLLFNIGLYFGKGTKTAYKFTVITYRPDEIIDDITHIMRRGSTRIEGVGAYSGQERTVIICVVDRHQLNDFRNIIDNHPETFAFSETVTETYGNFKKLKRL